MGIPELRSSALLWLRSKLRAISVASEIDDEIRFHIDQETRQLMREGIAAREASAEALRRFGNPEVVRSQCRQEYFLNKTKQLGIEMFFQNLRYAFRSLRRNPGFTGIAILTLALGIGGNTAMFTLVNSVVFNPLPYSDSDRLVALWHSYPEAGLPVASVSAMNYTDYARETDTFEIAAYTLRNATLTGGGDPVRFSRINATTNYFDVLKVDATLGRTFVDEESQVGNNRVVVLSHATWVARFGRAADIVGTSIVLDNVSHEVVGVLPADFISFPPADIYAPLAFPPDLLTEGRRGQENLAAVARLAPGVDIEQAQARVDQIALRLREENGRTGFYIVVGSFQDFVLGATTETALLMLLGSVGLVLLIGCANVASLLFAQGEARQREIAVRMALGGQRGTLIRQMITESMVLGSIGGIAGLVLAVGIIKIVTGLPDLGMPRSGEVSLDTSVLLFTGGISAIASLLFGVAPAFRATADALGATLRDGDAHMSGGKSSVRARNALVVTEVAMAVVLLISAGLMIKSFGELTATDAGFDPENIFTAQVSLPQDRYSDNASRISFFNETLEEIRALPGVTSAGAIIPVPFSGNWSGSFRLASVDYPPEAPPPNTKMRYVTEGYFESMGIPLISGRFFDSFDTEDNLTVLIVDETFVQKYMGPGDPIGQEILGSNGNRTIVGVVGAVQDMQIGQVDGHIYWPYNQTPIPFMTYMVKAAGDPMALTSQVSAVIRARDASLVPFDVSSMDQRLAVSTANSKFTASLIGAFAGLALLLAVTGIYGVISYTVAQRTNEIGIRAALGASSSAVTKLVVLQGVAPALVGVVLGLIGGFAATRLMTTLLFGVSPTDPMVFGGVTLTICAVILLAAVVPALKASRISPMEALRYE